MKKPFAIIVFCLCFLPGGTYAARTVDSILGIHFAPELEAHVCNKVEETSQGEINKTGCLLKVKYVNEICLEMINVNFAETVPDEDKEVVEGEFIMCRFTRLMGYDYEFGMTKNAKEKFQE